MRKINFLNRTLLFLVLAILFLPTVWAQSFEMDDYDNLPEAVTLESFDLRAYQCIAADFNKKEFEGFGRNARAEAMLGCEDVSDGCRITQCGWL